jgi:hypothetical protein
MISNTVLQKIKEFYTEFLWERKKSHYMTSENVEKGRIKH